VTNKYVHPELGKEVVFGIAGHYTPQQEAKVAYNGRQVLYEVGEIVMESACCDVEGWVYTSVPGYVVNWQNSTSDAGLPVSEIEPITDAEAKEKITSMIQAAEGSMPVEFWP